MRDRDRVFDRIGNEIIIKFFNIMNIIVWSSVKSSGVEWSRVVSGVESQPISQTTAETLSKPMLYFSKV